MMKNKNDGTVTISLNRYNELVTYEKAIYEKKSVSIHYGYAGTYTVKLVNEVETHEFFLEKFTKMQKEIDEQVDKNIKSISSKKWYWL